MNAIIIKPQFLMKGSLRKGSIRKAGGGFN